MLPATARKDVEDAKNLDVLRQSRGVWFDGGNQSLYFAAYQDTKAAPLFHDVLRRGGVIGGTSAGTTIQGDYLVGGKDRKQASGPHKEYPRSLHFLPGTAVDQHFTRRNRFGDMTLLLKNHPRFLGIGLDESTALIVRGCVGEIMGKGNIHFYDRNRPVKKGQPDYETLAAGGRYDLKSRKILPPAK